MSGAEIAKNLIENKVDSKESTPSFDIIKQLSSLESNVKNGTQLDIFKGLISTSNNPEVKDKASESMKKVGDILNIQVPFLGSIWALFGTKRPIDILWSKEQRTNKKFLNGILKFFWFKNGLEGLHESYITEQLKWVDMDFGKNCFNEYKKLSTTDISEDKKTRNICGLEKMFTGVKDEIKTKIKDKIPEDFENIKTTLTKEFPNNIDKININTVRMIDPSLIIVEDKIEKVDITKIQTQPEKFIDAYLKTTIRAFAQSGDDFIASDNVNKDTFTLALFGNITGEKFFVEGVSLGLITPENQNTIDTNPTSNEAISSNWEVKKETTDYNSIVEVVIEKIEWGYYNPKTMNTKWMRDSGETMMWIDRKHGGSLNTSTAGKEFWKIIDEDKIKNPNAWKQRGYKGWALESTLRWLAGQIIKPHYENLAKTYLSEESQKIVNSDGRLMFNFIYSARNGARWFQRMATEINNKVNWGIKDTNILIKDIVDWRIYKSGDNLIAQWGRKIEDIVGLVA